MDRWVSEIVLDLNTQFQIHSGSETHDEEQHSVGEGGGVEDVRGNEERDTEEGTAEEEETTRFEGVDAEVTVDDVADDEKDDDDMTDEGSTIHVAHPEESNMEAYMEENENEEEEEISGDRVGTHQAVTVTASIEEDEGAITEEGEAIHVANFEQLDTIEEVEENTAEHDEVTYLGESCGGPETEEDEEATVREDPEEANSHASSPAFFEADEGNANVSMEATDIVTAPNVVISEDVAEVVEEAVVPKEAYT
ncbi:hypothetical protein M7I_6227 [Glarea lozoyensis 74030]|uniref:Uncharacterized protein n=1 Tax=Glarea lozoyensis (strain ATCC 74030 / MF5533) TaxID=1104152 RepID=H0EU02_GLAL7|nr:hypothetical protein M7I_6227 [Glarea lozoyensis 74030]